MVRLDLTDLANPTVVSVALDPTSEDGEVNSHSVWPSEDGRIVVEGEKDFAPFKLQLFINEGLIGIFDAAEAVLTPPIADLPDRAFSGEPAYAGLGCTGGPAVPAGDGNDIAVVQRGDCTFVEKVRNIAAAAAAAGGYSAVVIFNSEAGGAAAFIPGGSDQQPLPTIGVGHSTGLVLLGVESADELVIGMEGEAARGESTLDGWSGLRIWDYPDPANPVLASTFNTRCMSSRTGASRTLGDLQAAERPVPVRLRPQRRCTS